MSLKNDVWNDNDKAFTHSKMDKKCGELSLVKTFSWEF
jgi:hypothetical protein